mmetsp:Transcript_101429/g.293376  ORF Transcript_101429/g.293376 Transcript_101429/m.293376 type:complete len:254 (-) Transcript_101429:35-796(-)
MTPTIAHQASVCKYWKRGLCKQGHKCRFLHNGQSQTAASEPWATQQMNSQGVAAAAGYTLAARQPEFSRTEQEELMHVDATVARPWHPPGAYHDAVGSVARQSLHRGTKEYEAWHAPPASPQVCPPHSSGLATVVATRMEAMTAEHARATEHCSVAEHAAPTMGAWGTSPCFADDLGLWRAVPPPPYPAPSWTSPCGRTPAAATGIEVNVITVPGYKSPAAILGRAMQAVPHGLHSAVIDASAMMLLLSTTLP